MRNSVNLIEFFCEILHFSPAKFLQDRFAAGRTPPTVDEQQDWILKSGEEENGFTILEFSRKYVTCDDYDLPITVSSELTHISLGINTRSCFVGGDSQGSLELP